MSIIAQYFVQAELALAAYAELNAEMSPEAYRSALQQANVGMSPSQAHRFARDWRVVAQYAHSEAVPLLDEFNQPTGEYVLRSNGLVVTLFEEVGTGRQAVAVRGTERGDAADWTTNVIDIGILGTPERQAQYRSLVEKVSEWRESRLLRDGFAVTGHSLGGFLAAALAIEWAGRIAAAYLYNAPGLGGVMASEAVAERVWRALSPAGMVSGGAATSIHNLVAVGDPVGGLIGVPVAQPQRIVIEQTSDPIHNHSIVTLTDALAVYDLFSRVDANLQLSAIGELLKAASARSEATLESVVQSLRELNPFAILGLDYSRFNRNGELDLFDPATGQGTLTRSWLEDRASFLTGKLWAGTNDRRTESQDALAVRSGPMQYFEDRGGASTYKLYQGLGPAVSGIPVTTMAQYLFGGSGTDTLTGGEKWDKLYGGDGADSLTGGKGNDYLEGGQGTDTYTYTSGDGLDTILDTDGLGKIQYDGIVLNGGNLLFGETYKSSDGKYLYTLLQNTTGQDLLVSGMGGQIVVKDFQPGELGNVPMPAQRIHRNLHSIRLAV